jgi:type I restriction enzyme R subunit
MGGHSVIVNAQGRFLMGSRDGKPALISVEEYRRAVLERVVREAHNLDEFRTLWITAHKRRALIDHLLGDHLSPEAIREAEQMSEFDLYDFFGKHGYNARALRRSERGAEYIENNRFWFDALERNAAIVLQGLGTQFIKGGTDALETPTLWEVPAIRLAGGLDALRAIGPPVQVMQDAKGRLFGA